MLFSASQALMLVGIRNLHLWLLVAQRSEVWHVLWVSLSHSSHTQTVQDINICFASYDRGIFLVCRRQISPSQMSGFTSNECSSPHWGQKSVP